MKVLNLVTTPRPFFNDQCRVLKQAGVDITTIQVPGQVDQGAGRSVLDYVRFYPSVLQNSIRDFDIVHANFGLTGPFALAQPRRPVVLSLWGSDLEGKRSDVSRLCARLSDEVIVMGEEMENKLSYDCHVIPHGVDLQKFKPIPQEDAQRNVGWDSDIHQVLFPYNPKREVKNYPLAERIVEQVQDEMSEKVELQVVYSVDHEDIPWYMNASDALLLTSDWEGSPNSVKEAMACNLPVVSVDVGDVRERISGVSNSYVGKSESELVDYLVKILRKGNRANSRKNVQELSLERMGEQILDVYQSIIK